MRLATRPPKDASLLGVPVSLCGPAAELIDTPYAIDDTLLVEAAPGHTPGHVLLKLRTPGGAGLFCGDVIHHPLPVVATHWNSRFCERRDEARATRRAVLEHCAASGAMLLPTHFGAPHVARIQGVAHVPSFVAPDIG